MIQRRNFLTGLAAASMTTKLAFAKKRKAAQRVLLGTNAGGTSKGIYIADWNGTTGEIGPMSLAASIDSPTFIVKYPHNDGLFIFSVSEKSKGSGQVASYFLQNGASTLKEINRQDTQGGGATHLSIHPDGRSLFVANYGGGSVSSFHIRPDGSISPVVSHFQYTGHGPNPDRQEKPHAHSAQISPDGKYLLVNDLGLDRIVVYRVNAATAELLPNDPPYWPAKPGSGPRHIAFHPNGRFVFSVNELHSTVDTLSWDAKEGSLNLLSTVKIVPDDFPVDKARAGEIAITGDGHYVYVNNRGHESIAVMTCNPKTGELKVFELAKNGGTTTRYITLDPTESWLVANNQDAAGNVAVLKRDHRTGKLSDPLHVYPLDRSMFTLFV